MSNLPSTRFIEVYDTLPPESQRVLLERHLAPLLNRPLKQQTKQILFAAKQLANQHRGIPKLDLKAKKIEIQGLLDAITTDSKRSFVKERSNKDALVSEIVDSLTDWLNDIWTVVYEYKVNFELAHDCLLFVATALEEISESRGGCKCAYTNLFVKVVIKNRARRTIKTFNLSGAQQIDHVLLWIWRDLFLSLLASDNTRQKDSIPEMLGEIEHVKSWRALERIIYGGKYGSQDVEDELDVEDEDEGEEDHEEDYYTDSEDGCEHCTCSQHAPHWTKAIGSQRFELRELIQNQLMTRFELMPSLSLHHSLLSLSLDPDETEDEMQDILAEVATSSSDTFAAALNIYSNDDNPEPISTLLITHYHLLRPRDASILQSATVTLAGDSDFTSQSLQILEKELMDTARALRAAVSPLFNRIEEDTNKQEIVQIAKLRHGSAQRQDRVERWVDKVVTPGRGTPNPMALAAFMMGLPIAPGMEDDDDADPLGYLDQPDTDLEDLREEFRPKIQERFDGWTEVALVFKGGPAVLMKVYTQIIALMPFFRVHDVVEEMISRLAEKPSKHYVCDALDTISRFCKEQKKKLAAKAEKKKKAAALAAAKVQAARPHLSTNGPPSVPPGMGGMEDVD